jgi:hypothetical protein
MQGLLNVLKSRKGIALLLTLGIVLLSFFVTAFEPLREHSATILVTVVLAFILGTAFEDAALKLGQNPNLEAVMQQLVLDVVGAVLETLGGNDEQEGTPAPAPGEAEPNGF